jgi:gliding motility-associated-like protein
MIKIYFFMLKLIQSPRLLLLMLLLFAMNNSCIYAQTPTKPSRCANSDFSMGDFTNWVGYTSVYPNTPETKCSIPHYYNKGIVYGRHTIITQSTPDPFTCGNVLTLPPGEKQCVRLGNGGQQGDWGNGVEWQIDYLDYTFSITPSNSLLIYKYAVILQEPTEPVKHEPSIRPRFIVTIKDASGKLIDPVCGMKEDFADASVFGYRNCPQKDAEALGGIVKDPGPTVYRAWTTVGVDLRKFIGQDITVGFQTWDCGLGGHFGYAYLLAKCDSLGIKSEACSDNGSVKLTAPDGFAYKWLPGGQSTQTITINDAKAGDEVEVELTTISGCKTNLKTVIYPQKTTANFIVNPTTVCLNTPISFTDSSYSINTFDQSKIPIVAWHWDFGDSTYASTATISHTYKKPGDYKVVLTATSAEGCSDSIIKYVKVLPAPFANFKFKDVCVNDSVKFKDISTSTSGGVITSGWLWTFGDDNSTSTQQNPTHLFTTAGTFAIKLAIDNQGCTDDTVQMIKIYPSPAAKYSVNQPCLGEITVFADESTTTDNTDPITAWIYNFGDGSPFSADKNPSHYYAKDSVYKSSLIVTTARGCIGTTALDVRLHPQPIAKFSATPLCLSTPVVFTDLSTPAGEVTEWHWSYNDKGNNQSTIKNPSFNYDTSGVYFPKLVVKSIYGCIDSTVLAIDIPPLPVISFDANKYESCVPLSLKFNDASYTTKDPIVKWDWIFGDGNVSSEQHPNHVYTNAGVYTVTLSITTANSCTQTYTWKDMIKVYPIPVAGFSFTPLQPTESDNQLTFVDESSGANFWNWNFGDDGFSALQNPSHTYKGTGSFTIWQYVKNIHNCVDSTAETIVIKPSWTFYAPNVFTPNKDGKNEGFIPKGYNITEFQMWIFDRWGNMIYETEKVKDPASAVPWDGHANGGPLRAQQDTYVWLVKLKDINGESHRYIGRVSIVR